MTRRPSVLLSISLVVTATAAAAAEPARREWRPATTADGHGPAPAGSVTTQDAPRAPAQRAYVDPQTGALIPAPAIPPEPQAADRTALKSAHAKGRPLQVTPEGHLYIDTSDYQMLTTAHLGPDGQVHTDCRVIHDASTAAAGNATSRSGEE